MLKKLGIPFYVAIAVLIAGIALVQRVPHGKSMPLQKDFTAFMYDIGEWKGQDQPPMDPKTLNVLRVDNYLDRVYENSKKNWISLYVGYFRDQISGQIIHSPRNCMPGAGWNFIQNETVTLDIPGKTPLKLEATRAILSRGEDRLLAYFWYQSRGRLIASEYWDKVYLVLDAIRYNRTDGALVRVLTELPKDGDITTIDAQLKAFIQAVTPSLQYEYFPPGVGS
jgi:EpsI family protein